jgi:hypothetical protein
MSLGRLIELYQFFWMFESHAQQRLAWKDAEEARIARARAEARSQAQLRAMLIAHPSGSLGHSQADDDSALKRSGLL